MRKRASRADGGDRQSNPWAVGIVCAGFRALPLCATGSSGRDHAEAEVPHRVGSSSRISGEAVVWEVAG